MSPAPVRIATAALTLALLLAAAGQGKSLLLEQPYDQITLRRAAGGGVYKVRPLQLPGGRVPDPFPAGKLTVRLVDELAQPYELLWSNIRKVETFPQLLLAEADKLIKSRTAKPEDFDKAFPYFQRLFERYPDTPGLSDATSRYLQRNAAVVFRDGQFDRALAILGSLHARQPGSAGLAKAVDTVADQIIQGHLKKRNFRSARSVLDVVAETFQGEQLTVVDKWRTRFRSGADDQVRLGVKRFRARDYRGARSAATQAIAIWPPHEQAAKLLALVERANPAIVVGVRTASAAPFRPRIDSLPALRTGYLAAPTLARLADYSPEGGIYASPIGALGLDATGRELSLTVLDYRPGSADALAAPASVARWLLRAADRTTSQHRPELASLVGAVLTPEPDLLAVSLARSHVRPEALLVNVTLGECELPFPDGVYTADQVEPGALELRAAWDGAAVSVVEERLIESDADAAAALVRGDVDVLARVAPWQVTPLRGRKDVVVREYRLPTVHVLVPSRDNELLGRREFRRALLYGIDRQRILDEQIAGVKSRPGFQVISGPFPSGMSLIDPVRYAYNDAVSARSYQPRLAALLAALTWANLQDPPEAEGEAADEAEQATGEPEPDEEETETPPLPPLKLAHSSDPVARLACQSIKQQLFPLGIKIELVEATEEELHAEAPNFDLRYAELAVWEPVTDAKRVLGPEGVAGRCSDSMYSALRRLDEARNWNEAIETLREIHELAAGDLPVIPLWQTGRHYAHRKTVTGLPASTIYLYQSIADWRKQTVAASR